MLGIIRSETTSFPIYPSSAQTGDIRTLHEKGSGQNRCPDCETDRGGYHSFDINYSITTSYSAKGVVMGVANTRRWRYGNGKG